MYRVYRNFISYSIRASKPQAERPLDKNANISEVIPLSIIVHGPDNRFCKAPRTYPIRCQPQRVLRVLLVARSGRKLIVPRTMAARGPGKGEWLSWEDGRLCQSRDLNLARFQRTQTDERKAIINATRNMEGGSPLCNGNMTTGDADPGLCSGKGS